MPRPITTDEPLGEPLGEDVDNDSDDNIFIKGMSDILIVCNLLLLLFLLLTVKLRFQESSQTLNLTNTTPSLTWSFKRRSLFDVQSGCIR